MTKENQTQQPVSGAMTDEQIIETVREIVERDGYDVQDGHQAGLVEAVAVATVRAILSRAQDAQAIRNSALEEAASKIKASQLDQWSMFFHMVRALQSAPAQPIERPDELAYIEACNLAKAIYAQHYREGAEHWRVLPDLRGVISQISNMVAGMTRKQRGNAQEPVTLQSAYDAYITKEYGGLTEYAKRHTGSSARFECKAFEAGYAAAPQVAQEPEQAAPAVPEVMTLRKALEDLIEDIHFGPLDLQREALERARLALAAAPAAPSVAAQQVAQEEGAQAERYRFLRSMVYMTAEEQEDVSEAMHSVFPPDKEGLPTEAEFDASIDAGMRAAIAKEQGR